MYNTKKVAVIQDISGYGRASLTIAIPVISAMGSMVCPMPTAVLSAQTLYSDYKMVDLTDQIEGFAEHWKKIGIEFDCIYSGFLASISQIERVKDVMKMFKTENNITVVDPVMGDDGKRFSLFDKSFINEMRGLVKSADLITPNLTEAGLLLGYDEEIKHDISMETAEKWRKELSKWGIRYVVITSVKSEDGRICTLAYDREKKEFYHSYCTKYPIRLSGTGDTYTSVLVGALMQGDGLEEALTRATQFLSVCIKDTYENCPDTKEFIFEPHLIQLIK